MHSISTNIRSAASTALSFSGAILTMSGGAVLVSVANSTDTIQSVSPSCLLSNNATIGNGTIITDSPNGTVSHNMTSWIHDCTTMVHSSNTDIDVLAAGGVLTFLGTSLLVAGVVLSALSYYVSPSSEENPPQRQPQTSL